MNNNYTVLEGKSFTVDLMSNVGSTNYGWCLTSMPKEIILFGTDTIPVEPIMAGGKSIQRFYFGAKSSENTQVTLQFELLCMSELSKAEGTYTLEVQIVPCNSDDYVKYSENAEQAAIPYGYVYDNNPIQAEKYGYPCGAQDAMTASLKYGYPCATQTALDAFPLSVKYGYPCTVAYGVPNPTLDYGYPVVAYGYPCRVAYGYPNGGWR